MRPVPGDRAPARHEGRGRDGRFDRRPELTDAARPWSSAGCGRQPAIDKHMDRSVRSGTTITGAAALA